MSRCRPALQRLCPLSMGRAPVPPNHGATASYRLMQSAGHQVWRCGCWFPCLGCQHKPHKNREKGGALALGGHQSSKKCLNNQLIVGGSSMGDVRAEVRRAGSVWGDIVQSFGVVNRTMKKIIIKNTLWLLAAAGLSFYTQQSTKTDACEGEKYGEDE
jgi:hypothetical protein